MTSDICAVVVTYNRLDKLKKALASYSAQELLPKYLVVVNNASTDETGVFLEAWQKQPEGFQKIVITSEENLGGSGGFYLGQKKALDLDADWVMLADDDAYPEPDYLIGMQNYIDTHDKEKISVVCGKVMEKGSPVNVHRAYLKSKWDRNFQAFIPLEYYEKEFFEPDFVSYVGIVINKSKLLSAGLVNKDFFIWYDDTEHSYRLSQQGKLICLPSYIMLHDVAEDNLTFSWKYYYGFRNNVVFFKKHFSFQYPFVIIKFLLKTLLCPLHGRSFSEVRLRFAAVKDGIQGNLGKHKLYKPGWKP